MILPMWRTRESEAIADTAQGLISTSFASNIPTEDSSQPVVANTKADSTLCEKLAYNRDLDSLTETTPQSSMSRTTPIAICMFDLAFAELESDMYDRFV